MGRKQGEVEFWQMSRKESTPKVGVGVIIRDKAGRILLMRRQGAHGAGEWSLPGGHHELGEDFLDVCRREVAEETGLCIEGVRKVGFTNDIFPDEGLHYVTLYFEAEWMPEGQTPENREPHKCDAIGWFDPLNLPEPIWSPLAQMIEEGALD